MKKLTFMFLVWFPVALMAAPESVREIDRIVAVVNDDVIVQSELERQARTVLAQLRKRGTQAPPQDILEKQVLERLIYKRLQLQAAKRRGIEVQDNTVDRAVQRLARKNQLSVAQFRDILEKDGYDFASFRENIREELTMDLLRRRVVENRIVVSDQEIQDLLNTMERQKDQEREYHLAHILIAIPEAASPETIEKLREKAGDVQRRLRTGEDFQKLAVAVSDGAQALEGGDLGWRKADRLPTLFADVVKGMSPGDVSGILRSASGFHVIKLLDARTGERHIVRQTHARHILIRANEAISNQEARTRLEQLKQRIEGGDDFAELARSNSDDRGSAARGGDLGWVSSGDVVPDFQRAMDALQPGEISEPFRSPFGWHIVQVLERRDHDSTEAVRKAKAKDIIFRRKVEEETQEWLRRLRDEAYVDYRLDE